MLFLTIYRVCSSDALDARVRNSVVPCTGTTTDRNVYRYVSAEKTVRITHKRCSTPMLNLPLGEQEGQTASSDLRQETAPEALKPYLVFWRAFVNHNGTN